jgi:hypothetical protein
MMVMTLGMRMTIDDGMQAETTTDATAYCDLGSIILD